MSNADTVWSVLAVAGVLILLVAGWQYAAVGGATTTAVGNEQQTVRGNTSLTLDTQAVRYNVTNVTAPPNSTKEYYTEPEDYRFDEWSGTLTWTQKPDDVNGSQAGIDYRVEQRTDRTRQLAGLLYPLRELFPFLLFLVIGGGTLALVRSSWGT